jgi:hypothetical protein
VCQLTQLAVFAVDKITIFYVVLIKVVAVLMGEAYIVELLNLQY